ncbi:MAG: hypothetical protein SFW36_04540 [Leptolyngbyaceae cyanobacterium bins.59]|nr:hypothetical protein [Leptolyngbyaceae cyanobacterium bins.59]
MKKGNRRKRLAVDEFRQLTDLIPLEIIDEATEFSGSVRQCQLPEDYVGHIWADDRSLIELIWNPVTRRWLLNFCRGKDNQYFSKVAKALALAVSDRQSGQT